MANSATSPTGSSTTTTGSTMDNTSNLNNTSNTGSSTYSATPATTDNSTYSSTTTSSGYDRGRESRTADKPYKAVSFGVYGGLNSTRFRGEEVNSEDFNGRLGYQLGAYLRAGGRIYGQIGAEYLASTSKFYQQGSGTTLTDIRDNIAFKSLHIPAYIGIKLLQSDRGISALRLQGGVEYSTTLDIDNNEFDFKKDDFRKGVWNGVGNVGIDVGIVSLDLVYHHGFADVWKDGVNPNRPNGQRRIWALNLGLKF